MILGAMYENRSSLENPATNIGSQELGELLCSRNGITVSPATAQKLTAVYACIYVLSSTMAQLPLSVLRKVDGNIVPATDHPAHYLLHDEPNPSGALECVIRRSAPAHALEFINYGTGV